MDTNVVDLEIRQIDAAFEKQILELARQVNGELSVETLRSRLEEMFGYGNYFCFGFFLANRLVGVSSGWVTTRFYSGRQLEIDNVIVDAECRSLGYGELLLGKLEQWACDHGCLSVELNTYVENARSHKFYFNQGFHILGYHFEKRLTA